MKDKPSIKSTVANGLEIAVVDEMRNYRIKLHVNDTLVLNHTARMAAVLIEKWGMVAAMPDGEDSSGRSKSRLATPSEMIERACDTAALLMSEAKRRGWTAVLPTQEEIHAPSETKE